LFRFFLGLGLGVILTLISLGFAGVGHGSYAPMAFTVALIGFTVLITGDLTVTLVLAPFLWALYFLFIPKIQRRWLRIGSASAIMLVHVLIGGGLAINDRAFLRADLGAVLGFTLLATITISCLMYFVVRGDAVHYKSGERKSRSPPIC
jgi:hypothetical protein